MATATATLVLNNDTDGTGFDETQHTQTANGKLVFSAGNYVKGGLALNWLNMRLGTTTGNIALPQSRSIAPYKAFLNSVAGSGWRYDWNKAASTVQILTPAPSTGTPIGLSAKSAFSTAVGVTSNVITVTMANNLTPGAFILLSGFTAGAAFNGIICQVVSASATQFTVNYPTANITAATADTTGTYQMIQGGAGNFVVAGASASITNSLATTTQLTMTCVNSFTPGQFVVIQGLTNGATSNGVIVQIDTASATQFTATWRGTAFSTGADIGTATLLVTAGGSPVITDIAATITNSVATASSAGVQGVITLTLEQSFDPGNIVVIEGLTNGAVLNGAILTVNQTGLTTTSFVANHPTAAVTTGADTGTASILVTGPSPVASPQIEYPDGAALAASIVADVVQFEGSFLKG